VFEVDQFEIKNNWGETSAPSYTFMTYKYTNKSHISSQFRLL